MTRAEPPSAIWCSRSRSRASCGETPPTSLMRRSSATATERSGRSVGKRIGATSFAEHHRRPGRVASGKAIHEGIDAIEAAASDGLVREPSVRIAGAGGKIYLDLCSEDWQTVEIDADGWRVVADPPVFFVRPAGMR